MKNTENMGKIPFKPLGMAVTMFHGTHQSSRALYEDLYQISLRSVKKYGTYG
jgi:hypothetical protein